MTLRSLLAAVLLSLLAHPGVAQTITNPDHIDFTASVDHATTEVTTYSLEIQSCAATPCTSGPLVGAPILLGKPALSPTPTDPLHIGPIVIPAFQTIPDGTYIVQVTVVGPGGSNRSDASAPPFVRQRPVVVNPPAKPGRPVVSRPVT